MTAASIAGIKAVLLDAISDEARAFCEGLGCYPSPLDPITMMITLADVEKVLAAR